MDQTKPQITIGQLKNFILVVEEKGFQAAAKKVSRSQPAISKSIKKLEAELGGALFEKSSNATLTSLGSYFFPQAKELIIQYDKIITDIWLFSHKQAGQVTLAVLPSIAGSILPGIIKEYTFRYPNLQINVQDTTSRNIYRRVLNGTVDFGLSHLWEKHPDLDFIGMLKDPVGLVCASQHPLAQAEVVTWEMLTNYKIIDNGTVRLLQDTPAEAIVRQAQLSISNMTSLLAILEANIGITMLPYLAFPENNPKLCFKPISNPTIERTIGLLSRRKFTGSPAVQAMKEIVLEHFQLYTS